MMKSCQGNRAIPRIRTPSGRGKRHRATFALPAAPCDVDQNPEKPGLQARATLEPIESANHRHPRVLDNIIGDGVGDVHPRHPSQTGVVAANEFPERLIIGVPEPFNQRRFGLRQHRVRHPWTVRTSAARRRCGTKGLHGFVEQRGTLRGHTRGESRGEGGEEATTSDDHPASHQGVQRRHQRHLLVVVDSHQLCAPVTSLVAGSARCRSSP
jgi:hypothetical protein